ncbi:MAG: substrate-binding domain-containing protein [Pseudomonadota bacterium]
MTVALFLLFVASAQAQQGRNYIAIVGSSTVYPFSTVVAERFGRGRAFRTPKVESTGSGGGLKAFCAGVGARFPDIANASRRIKASELALCEDNGVEAVLEVKVGYDGIVLANAAGAPRVALTRTQLWLALAKNVPAADGSERLISNPYQRWRDIDPSLPDAEIEVLGPPPTSGTRDAFVELAMTGGCQGIDWIRDLQANNAPRFRAICQAVREDGHFVETGENDNLVVQKLRANPSALGILGFSFVDQNTDKVQGSVIDGYEPTFENIATGRYAVSRSLYFYVKRAHIGVIPGLGEFVAEFTSERAWGRDGYLASRGLIPMPASERAEYLASVLALSPVYL